MNTLAKAPQRLYAQGLAPERIIGILEQEPRKGTWPVRLQVAQIKRLMGDFTGARAELDQILDWVAQNVHDVDITWALNSFTVEMARIELSEGNATQALTTIKEVTDDEPTIRVLKQHVEGDCLIALGDFNGAIEMLEMIETNECPHSFVESIRDTIGLSLVRAYAKAGHQERAIVMGAAILEKAEKAQLLIDRIAILQVLIEATVETDPERANAWFLHCFKPDNWTDREGYFSDYMWKLATQLRFAQEVRAIAHETHALYLNASILVGNYLAVLDRYQEAIEIFRSVLDRSVGHTKALVANSTAFCLLKLAQNTDNRGHLLHEAKDLATMAVPLSTDDLITKYLNEMIAQSNEMLAHEMSQRDQVLRGGITPPLPNRLGMEEHDVL